MAIHAKPSGLMVAVRILEEASTHWYIHALDEKRPKYVMKNGCQGRVFGDNASIEEVECWISKQLKPKVSVLTNAQVYTLRRMASGTEYRMQGNGKRAFERRYPNNIHVSGDVNAPSIRPLVRKGLVQIDPRYTNPNPTSYYPVVLTAEGVKAAKEAVIND